MHHGSFDNLADQLAPSGIKKSNMFGMPVLKLDRKPVAGLDKDGVTFRLPADSEASKQALSLEGSHYFRPESKGKKGPLMKNWVVVPFAHEAKYIELIAESTKFVESEL